MKSSLIQHIALSALMKVFGFHSLFFLERRNTVQIKKPADVNTQSLNNKSNVGKFPFRLLRTNVVT